MHPYTDSKLDTFILLRTGIEVSHSSKNSQTSTYCSLGIIFMGVRIAKVCEYAIAQIFGDVAIELCNDFATRMLVGENEVAQFLGIELLGQWRRPDQIAKHHGQLPSLPLRSDRPCSGE